MKKHSSSKTKDDYTKYLRTEGYSKSTIAYHVRSLSLLEKWTAQEHLETAQLSYNDLLAYIKYKQNKGTSKTGMSRYLNVIKRYYAYLVECGQVSTSPALRIKLHGVPRNKLYSIFMPEELQNIYHRYISAPQKWIAPCEYLRNKVMTGLLIYQGLKSEELIKLEHTDVKLREGEIEIPGGKRSNARTLTLEACQIMDVHQYITEGRKELLRTNQESEKLFIGKAHEKNLSYTLYRLTNHQLKKIEPRIQNLEQIRASVIAKWLKSYNLREVQYMAGHRYISSTEIFLQSETEMLAEGISKYHPLG